MHSQCHYGDRTLLKAVSGHAASIRSRRRSVEESPYHRLSCQLYTVAQRRDHPFLAVLCPPMAVSTPSDIFFLSSTDGDSETQSYVATITLEWVVAGTSSLSSPTSPVTTTKADIVTRTMTSVSMATWTVTESRNSSTSIPMPSIIMMPAGGLSAGEVVGIAAGVVLGTLCILAAMTACLLCYRREKAPSHKFVPLRDTGEDPPGDSSVFLHIAHNKSSWMHDEAEPLAWSVPTEPRTPLTPASPVPSDLLTTATLGSPTEPAPCVRPVQERQEVPDEQRRAKSHPQSRASRMLSWIDPRRSLRMLSDADRASEVDSGLRFRYELRRVSTPSALVYTPPPYSEA
ncbi:uncharacterized protein C8Q71DRAFT_790072 [Rhodofomes roseus]|uniref:Uncharacterized protein n=1 Tax=Rhodofomes roseus TaxID=34475 RepID=A0ABQ8JZ70_9APHY|nr:uncharacterized protein C8Q71DRAFT_790072 [Rhodofomes roseus]KAH9829599.1 hypothetical protein C8Q71DRAFT_790072 [Rhodofomes roseus]